MAVDEEERQEQMGTQGGWMILINTISRWEEAERDTVGRGQYKNWEEL